MQSLAEVKFCVEVSNDVFSQSFEKQNMSENKIYLWELSYHTTLSLALIELFMEQYFAHM